MMCIRCMYMCMYTHTYMYMCMYTHTYMYTTYIYLYMYIHICLCECFDVHQMFVS
jgi:hypothetical protein